MCEPDDLVAAQFRRLCEALERVAADMGLSAAIYAVADVLTEIFRNGRQVRGLGPPGHAFLAISTSGRSANVLAALRAARRIGMTSLGFAGGGEREMAAQCDHCLAAPVADTALIQQIHLVATYAICGLVERNLFRPGAAAAAR